MVLVLLVFLFVFLFFPFSVIATFLPLMSHDKGGRAIIRSDLCFTKFVGMGGPSRPCQRDSVSFPKPASAYPLHVSFLLLGKARVGTSPRQNVISWLDRVA